MGDRRLDRAGWALGAPALRSEKRAGGICLHAGRAGVLHKGGAASDSSARKRPQGKEQSAWRKYTGQKPRRLLPARRT